MINLTNLETNQFVIYDIDHEAPYYLVGFMNGFSKEWKYVVPTVLVRNSRYVEFQIRLVNYTADPLQSFLKLRLEGNYDYKIWTLTEPGLIPDVGVLVDSGQMYLNNLYKEVPEFTFISNNEANSSIVYLNQADKYSCPIWETDLDHWNLAPNEWDECN
jgi:hypothetical protein